jgi:hypothetical protein
VNDKRHLHSGQERFSNFTATSLRPLGYGGQEERRELREKPTASGAGLIEMRNFYQRIKRIERIGISLIRLIR